QIVKQRWRLGRGLFLFRSDASFPETTVLDRVRLRLVPNSFRASILLAVLREIFLEPATAIAAGFDLEIAEHLIIRARLELVNLVLALGQDCERRRLHSAHRC